MFKNAIKFIACFSILVVNMAHSVAQTPVSQFNVGIRIVDPCALKGQKWEKQCVQLKKQRKQQPKTQAKKPFKKQNTSDFPG